MVPGAHGVHVVLPVVATKNPAAHGVQLTLPLVAATNPAGQSVQAERADESA